MIDFAGVGLSVPDADLEELLSRWWHQSRVRLFDAPGFSTSGTLHLHRREAPERECPRLGVLHWPTGADRFATFHHLVETKALDRIRTALGTSTAGVLAIGDGKTTISPRMYLLPPRPVAKRDGKDLYLLSFVDDRYFWWMQGGQSFLTAPATWAALFAAVATKLGITITADSIPAAYSTPTNRWIVGYQPMPIVLEAAARSVGCRVVRQIDGTVKVVRWTTALAALDSQIALHDKDRMLGGRMLAADLAKAAPASVAVVFTSPTPAGQVHTAVTLAGAIATAAGYPSASTGISGAVGQFNADLASTAASGTRTTLADEAAADYYRWRLAAFEASHRGVCAWVPTGAEDAVEWDVRYNPVEERSILTRVLMPTASDANVYGGDGSSDGGEVWARITVVPVADPGPYTAVKGNLVANVWADVSPTVTYTTIYRAPSNAAPPRIAIGQYVRLVPSPTTSGAYEIDAVGAMQAVTISASQGDCYTTNASFAISGRDISVVTTPGDSGGGGRRVTLGPVVTNVTFNVSTCEVTVTKKNFVIDLCAGTATAQDLPGTLQAGPMMFNTQPT